MRRLRDFCAALLAASSPCHIALCRPLAAQAIYKAVIFGAFGLSKRAWTERQAPAAALPLPVIFCCGAIAGGVNSLVVCPVELVRNRLMVQQHTGGSGSGGSSVRFYTSSWDCARRVVATEGGPLALWQGLAPTLLRDAPGVGAWFAAFEATKRGLLRGGMGGIAGGDEGTLAPWAVLLSGGIGGVSFWLVALPFDAVKSIVQTQRRKGGGRIRYGRLLHRVAEQERGLLSLYRGLGISAARGFPSAAVVFLVQGKAKERLMEDF